MDSIGYKMWYLILTGPLSWRINCSGVNRLKAIWHRVHFLGIFRACSLFVRRGVSALHAPFTGHAVALVVVELFKTTGRANI